MLLQEMTWKNVDNLSRDLPIIFPVAAMEQHGHHAPLFTDSMLLGEVIRRTNERASDKALFAPLTWIGNSDHHIDFPGTISASPRLYLDLLRDLLENFIRHGFHRLMIVNGHGGNIVPGKQAVFELRQKYRDRTDLLLLFACYWDLGGRPQAHDPRFQQAEREIGHACEYETSMLLQLDPQLVQGDISELPAIPFAYGFEPAYRGWTTKDRTTYGHIGDPRHATADKGEFLFETYTSGLVELLDRMNGWNGRDWFIETTCH